MPKPKYQFEFYNNTMMSFDMFFGDDKQIVKDIKSDLQSGKSKTETLDKDILRIKELVNGLFSVDSNAKLTENDISTLENNEKELNKLCANLKTSFDKIKDGPYDYDKYRKLEFINDFIDMYDAVKPQLDDLAIDQQILDTKADIDNKAAEYEQFQDETVIENLGMYNNLVFNTMIFDSSDYPQKVKKILDDNKSVETFFGDLDSVVSLMQMQNTSIGNTIKETNTQFDEYKEEQIQRANIIKHNADQKVEIDDYFAQKQYDVFFKSASEDFERVKNVTESEIPLNALESIIDASKEAMLDSKNDAVSPEFKNGGVPFKEGEDPTNIFAWMESEDPAFYEERSSYLFSKYSELDDSINNIDAEISVINNNIKSMEASIPQMEANLKNVNKDKSYIDLKAKLSTIQTQNKGLEGVGKQLDSKGIRNFDFKSLEKYGINIDPDAYKQPAKIDENLKLIYGEIGNGVFSWPKAGKDLANSLKELNGVFEKETAGELYDVKFALEGLTKSKFEPKTEQDVINIMNVFDQKENLQRISNKPETSKEMKKACESVLKAFDGLEQTNSFEYMKEIVEVSKEANLDQKQIDLKAQIDLSLDVRRQEESDLAQNVNDYPRVQEEKLSKEKTALEQSKFEIKRLTALKAQQTIDRDYLVNAQAICTNRQAITNARKKGKDQLDKVDNLKAKKDNLTSDFEKGKQTRREEAANTKLKADNELKTNLEAAELERDQKVDILQKKQNKVKPFLYRLEKLQSTRTQIENKAKDFSDAQKQLDIAKQDRLDAIEQRKSEFNQSMNALEDKAFDKLKNTGKVGFNSGYYKKLVSAIDEYKLARDSNAENLNEKRTALDEKLKTYIEKRNDNGVKKSTDNGQIRLDTAKKIQSLLSQRNAGLANLDIESIEVEGTETPTLNLKTSFEKQAINKAGIEVVKDDSNLLSLTEITHTVADRMAERSLAPLSNKAAEYGDVVKTAVDNSIGQIKTLSTGSFAKALATIALAEMYRNKGADVNQIDATKLSILSNTVAKSDVINSLITDFASEKKNVNQMIETIINPDTIKAIDKSMKSSVLGGPEKQNNQPVNEVQNPEKNI